MERKIKVSDKVEIIEHIDEALIGKKGEITSWLAWQGGNSKDVPETFQVSDLWWVVKLDENEKEVFCYESGLEKIG